MALFDDQWFTGLQTAATSIGTAIVGAIGAWFALRKRIGTDSSELGLLRALQGERDVYKAQWLDAMNMRLETQEAIGRLKGLAEDAQARAAALTESEMHHREKVGGCEERVRLLTDTVMEMRLINGHMYTEMVKLDAALAERFLVAQLKPAAPPNGDANK